MDILKNKLVEIRTKITPMDKILAARYLHCHTETVRRYLRGEVKKNDFGCELYIFLNQRVIEREELIKNR